MDGKLGVQESRGLSVRERQVVDAVEAHCAAHGRPPILEEIGAQLVLEKSQTCDLVKAAARRGWLRLHCQKGTRTEISLTGPVAEMSTAKLGAKFAGRDRSAPETTGLVAGSDPEDLGVPLAA